MARNNRESCKTEMFEILLTKQEIVSVLVKQRGVTAQEPVKDGSTACMELTATPCL
jgi:hypothetical protein